MTDSGLKPFRFVSVSQVTLHRGCARKWWFHKRMGLPIQQAASAALGEEVHHGQETYILTGDESTVHPLARGSLPLLRKLRERRVERPERVFVERPLSYALDNGLTFTGKIDVLDTIADKPPLVLDWKTGNPAYFKTAEDLRRDPQMAAYAKTAIDLTDAGEVEVAHYGIPTKGSGGGYVSAFLTTEEVESRWLNLVHETDKLIETAAHESPGAVPHNPQNCMAYGRPCDFLEKCEALKSVRPVSAPTTTPHKEDPDMPISANHPFIARLRLTQQMFARTPMPVAFANAMRTGMPTDPAEVIEALAIVWPNGDYPEALNVLLTPAAETPAAPVVGAVAPPEAVKPEAPRPAADEPAEDAALDVEATQRRLLELGWSEDDQSHLGDEAFLLVSRMGWGRDEVLFDEVDDEGAPDGKGWTNIRPKPKTEPAPVVAEPAPTPRRRGRPPKPKAEAVVEAEPAPVIVKPEDVVAKNGDLLVQNTTGATIKAGSIIAVVETAPAPAPEGAPVVAVDAKAGLYLFVDCIPEVGYGAAQHLDTLLAPFMRMAAQNYKDEKTGKTTPLSHYGLIPYGKGPAIVAAYVMENLGVFTGTILVDSAAPCSAAVLEVLRPRADVIVTRRGR